MGFPNHQRDSRNSSRKHCIAEQGPCSGCKCLLVIIVAHFSLVLQNKIMNVFRRGDPADIHRARHVAEEVFGTEWESLVNTNNKAKSRTIWGIGK